jgi:hypothetical protein
MIAAVPAALDSTGPDLLLDVTKTNQDNPPAKKTINYAVE